MIKMWVDDIRVPPDDTWLWVKTSDQAINVLQSQPVTRISFDHDLGGEDDAYRIATAIEEWAFWNEIRKIEWSVHSANPVGRQRIETALRRADNWWAAAAAASNSESGNKA